MTTILNSLIHVATVRVPGGSRQRLFLRKQNDGRYAWLQVQQDAQEVATPIGADSAEEAIRLAWQHWQENSFMPLRCGYRFTLPERDEIGSKALFHQMVASYSTMNGIYLDEELGHQCIVHDASAEALALWAALR
jgi:hypothetical protein